jgi:ATP-binding cassette subfamily B protein
LVWQTSKPLTIADAALRIGRSAIPVALLYVAKLIIDEVVMLGKSHDTLSHSHLYLLIMSEFLLAIFSDVLSRLISLVDGLLGDLFSNYTSVKIM